MMITVNAAQKIIFKHVQHFPSEFCPLKEADGRILREDIRSDRDQPPFDKALMDGIAVSSRAAFGEPRQIFFEMGRAVAKVFPIDGIAAAGDKPLTVKHKDHCVRIMTGAVVPKGYDCVIPVEKVMFRQGKAVLKQGVIAKPGQNIRPRAADVRRGDIVLKKGTRLLPVHIGIAASVGRTKVKVAQRPRVAVVATGDELVDIGKPLAFYQTRLSNSYALRAALEQTGLCRVKMFHFPDDPKKILKGLRAVCRDFDVIVLSGGVSMGEFDHVPKVLSRMKVKKLFHKVAQKPGKPFWFGRTRDGKPVFALPGNPVSTLVCAYRYVIPYIDRACGVKIPQKYVALKGPVDWKTGLTCFVPVQDGSPVDFGGSGDFTSLGNADGFIQYEHGKKQTLWTYFSWRP